MKKKLASFLALGAFLWSVPFAGAGDIDQEQILKELEYLKQTVKFQEIKIQQLKAAMTEQKSETKPASDKDAKVSLVNSAIEQLEIKGDLRVRYERRERSNPDDSYGATNRERARFRLGGVWKNKSEAWEAGAGLATGGADGRSTNDTWGEEFAFETGDIRLDYAYAKHKIEDFSFTLGQQVNPFETSWLFWDGDLRPTGLTAQYNSKIGAFATLGGYSVRYYQTTTQDTGLLFAGQAGYKNKIGDVKLLAAAGFQYTDGEFNNNEAKSPKYEFRIGDFYAKAGIPLGVVELSPYAQIWCNFGADGAVGTGQRGGTLDPSEEDLGWILGLDATIQKFVKVGYAYAVVGADSLYGPFVDSDFGTGLSDTDVKGHRISTSFDITKNISAGATAFFFEAAERKNQREVDLYQVDVNYKF
jgi:hypothetical protein